MGGDLIIFHRVERRYYLLPRAENRGDVPETPLVPLPARNGTVWMREGGICWLLADGESIGARVKTFTFGKDVVKYDPVAGRYFIFPDFEGAPERRWTPARTVLSPNRTLWRSAGETYWFLREGEDIGEDSIFKGLDDDAFVYDPGEKKYYLIRDWERKDDGRYWTTECLPSPNGTLWKLRDNVFSMMLEGRHVNEKLEFKWDCDDGRVRNPSTGAAYLFEKCRNRDDGAWRPAVVLSEEKEND